MKPRAYITMKYATDMLHVSTERMNFSVVRCFVSLYCIHHKNGVQNETYVYALLLPALIHILFIFTEKTKCPLDCECLNEDTQLVIKCLQGATRSVVGVSDLPRITNKL